MTPPFLKRYFIALDQHKLIGLASFSLVVGISGVVAFQPAPPPSYLAKGALAYNTPPKLFSETGGEIYEQGRKLSDDLLLADNVAQQAAQKAQIKPQDIVRSVEIDFPKEDKPQIIKVKYSDQRSPEIAGSTLEVLMQQMVEQSRLINTTRLREIIKSIEAKLPEAKKELIAAEQKLEQYIRTEGSALLAAKDGTLVGGITGSQQQQRQIKLELDGIDAQIVSLESRLGLNADQAYASSALSADPLINNLRGQILGAETQIELLRNQGYRDTHPEVENLLKNQATYEEMLRSRASEVIGGNGLGEPLAASQIRQDSTLDPARQELANQLVQLQTQRDTLERQLATIQNTEQELRQEYQQLPNKQLEQARLENQVNLKLQFYNRLEAALADATAAETETVSSLSLLQPPQVEEVKEPAPNPIISLLGGAAIGLLVSGGLILLLATLDNTFYTSEDIKLALAQRDVLVLGELPLIKVLDPLWEETGILGKPDSPYVEFYERFRSNLLLGENKSLKVVLLTSTIEEEGKTVSAYNLAIASAHAGKRTLLIEADVRSSSQANFLKLTPDPNATAEPLSYYSSLSNCMELAPDIENLYIVPSPGPQRKAAAILESSELKRLFEDAKGRFDLVVVDSPALSLCNDALLLEPLADGIVIVTRPGYTQESILSKGVEEMLEAELPLLGAIINGVDHPAALSLLEDSIEYEEEESLETEAMEEDQVTTGTSTAARN
ncbi:MAG: polysaccharide biosynthesis tyrosine autokinase [Symploca sp. SIO2G7]|nr:polysaccharide biosynthesis tyrosine autokinase [Symploca sp. SIO2G7]